MQEKRHRYTLRDTVYALRYTSQELAVRIGKDILSSSDDEDNKKEQEHGNISIFLDSELISLVQSTHSRLHGK